jgi:hypothetical protein
MRRTSFHKNNAMGAAATTSTASGGSSGMY